VILRARNGLRVELIERAGARAQTFADPLDAAQTQGYGHWALEVDDLDAAFACPRRRRASRCCHRRPPWNQAPASHTELSSHVLLAAASGADQLIGYHDEMTGHPGLGDRRHGKLPTSSPPRPADPDRQRQAGALQNVTPALAAVTVP
jgi:hypothetical protein